MVLRLDSAALIACLAPLLFALGCPGAGSDPGDDDDAGANDDDASANDDDAGANDDDAAPNDDDASDDDDTSASDDDDTSEPECTTHSACDDDEFCRDQTCELIFGRSFEIRFVSATAGTTNGDGDTWDIFGGLPDPYGSVTLDDVEVLRTAVVDDDIDALWDEAENVSLTPTSLCFLVLDEDDSLDDLMDGSCWNDLDSIVALVRAGGHSGALFEGLVDVEVDVVPNF